MLRRGEDLHFASDLFPSIVGKAKGQESSFFFVLFKKKTILYKVTVFGQMLLSYNVGTLNFSSFFEFRFFNKH